LSGLYGCSEEPPTYEILEAETASRYALASQSQIYAKETFSQGQTYFQKAKNALETKDYEQARDLALKAASNYRMSLEEAARAKAESKQRSSQLLHQLGIRLEGMKREVSQGIRTARSMALKASFIQRRIELVKVNLKFKTARIKFESGDYLSSLELLNALKTELDGLSS